MTFEELLLEYLAKGYKPTRAVETALEEYNNSRSIGKGMSIRTAWYRYKKIKNNRKLQ